MVDAEDLKSFGHCDRVGSSPTIPTRRLKHRHLSVFYYSLVLSAIRTGGVWLRIVFVACENCCLGVR